jgi:uncharacterized protein (DUF1800 family)
VTPTPELCAIRFGHGLPLPAGAPDAPAAMLAALRGPDAGAAAFPPPPRGMAEDLAARGLAARSALRRDRNETNIRAYRAVGLERRSFLWGGLQRSLARAVASPDGLRERLVAFWSGHFATRPRVQHDAPLVLDLVEDAIRPHAAGRFADLLAAVTLHPAMLFYLDQAQSVGPGSRAGKNRKAGLNENLARELMELHTLGSGAPYTQGDVRELAELLTGLTVNDAREMTFAANRAEPGPETVLGTTYRGEGMAPIRALLADLAARPETAAHIARKLAVHFTADDPDPGLAGALAETFRGTGGDIAAVMETLLAHPAAWAADLAKVRPPVEYMATAVRALGVPADRLFALSRKDTGRLMVEPLRLMGQPWLDPPSPEGWPEAGADWITPQRLAARIAWAIAVATRLGQRQLSDPVEIARRALGSRATGDLLATVARAETRIEGIALVLATPALNRR